MSGAKQGPRVAKIFISAASGEPMCELIHVLAIKGVGLDGDRYAIGAGLYSQSRPMKVRHVTLIAAQAIEEANATLEVPFHASETRRNIVLEGISSDELNAFVGKGLRLVMTGPVLRGVELCTPCDWPDKRAGKSGFRLAFENRGGLRAAIVEGGRIIHNAELVPWAIQD